MQNEKQQTSLFSDIQGLSSAEVLASAKQHGYNTMESKKEGGFWQVLKNVVLEPMFLLLFLAASIYFILGEYSDGLLMMAAIAFVTAISLYQETRSKNALQALKKLTQPNGKVIRNGNIVELPTVQMVMGDFMLVEEGNVVPSDGLIVQSNDFSINEAILTGESFSVSKNKEEGNNTIYYGTLVTSGSAIAKVNAIGSQTELGKIGKSLENVKTSKTPLQLQINAFVTKMAGVGVVAFLFVWGYNYVQSGNVLEGLLNGLTLAMSVLPEEIPVAFATFMALGAWKLIKNGVLAKAPQTVESLGSATVICIDKTGTITENKMRLAKAYCWAENETYRLDACQSPACQRIVEYAMWSSEVQPFDPMEVAIHEAYRITIANDQRADFGMIHEYPLSGSPPMMTHLHENEAGQRIIAAKGGWETIIGHCGLQASEKQRIGEEARSLAMEGYRVLGVSSAAFAGDEFPADQTAFAWHFEGLIAMEDPPKQNISSVFQRFYQAGIQIKIITGDYLETAMAIARKTNFSGLEKHLTGEAVMKMNETTLREEVKQVNLFARMFPAAKLRVIEALKANGEVVAMTGDGVNDAPALKAAHIGVAMGKKGTETAKRAASMVIIDDNLDKIADAIFLGRRIYTNLKKAVQYIISIHIPIILTVSLPLLFGWEYANIFSPIHVIFFELIMGPTCSIIFENEPMEPRLLTEKPLHQGNSFFSFNELTISILQGLAITAGVLFMYKVSMDSGYEKAQVRTVAFTTILLSNIFLTLVNRSFYYAVFQTLRYPNKLVPLIIAITLGILAAALFIPGMQSLFALQAIGIPLFWKIVGVSFISVFWVEIYKWNKRRRVNP